MENKLQTLINKMVVDDEHKNLYVGNFLDEIKNQDIECMFCNEPTFIGLDLIDTVYIVSMVHKLLNDKNLSVPEWVNKNEYCLEKPYFWIKTEGKMKLYLLMESPLEFKIRNLFVSNNVLERV